MEFDRPIFAGIYRSAMHLKGLGFQQELDELMQTQFLTSSELQDIQLRRLSDVVDYARQRVPHYEEAFNGIVDRRLDRLSQLKDLPTVTKDVLKRQPLAMRSGEKMKNLTKKTTAGSTGEPFSLWKNSEALEKELAATWRGYAWANIQIGDRQGRFWGIPLGQKALWKSKAVDFLTHRKRIGAFSFDDGQLGKHTVDLLKFRPDYFYGYMSMLVEYAKYIRAHHDSSPFQLKGIVTTSEVLTKSARLLLESTFETKVYNEYGCAEFGTIAHECEAGSLHVAAENMIVEIVDGERNCDLDEVGEIVVTELSNRAMPLIRYRTGDLGAISSEKCSCGRELPVIGSIQGRAWDMLSRKDGRLFHPAFFLYIFEDAKDRNLGVEHYKVHQTDYAEFLIKIIPGKTYSKAGSEAFIRNEVRRKFDTDARIKFELVEDIPREASGKLRQVVGMKDISQA